MTLILSATGKRSNSTLNKNPTTMTGFSYASLGGDTTTAQRCGFENPLAIDERSTLIAMQPGVLPELVGPVGNPGCDRWSLRIAANAAMRISSGAFLAIFRTAARLARAASSSTLFARSIGNGLPKVIEGRITRSEISAMPAPTGAGMASALRLGSGPSGSLLVPRGFIRNDFLAGYACGLVVMLVIGCFTAKSGQHFTAAGEAADRITTRTGFIDGQVKQIPGNEPQKRTITEQTAAIRTDAGDIQAQLMALQNDFAIEHKQLTDMQQDGWVIWALRIKHAVRWIIITIVVGNVLAIIAGLNPLAFWQRASKEIVRLLPAMNVAAWIRDWINRRKLAKAQATDTLATMGAQ